MRWFGSKPAAEPTGEEGTTAQDAKTDIATTEDEASAAQAARVVDAQWSWRSIDPQDVLNRPPWNGPRRSPSRLRNASCPASLTPTLFDLGRRLGDDGKVVLVEDGQYQEDLAHLWILGDLHGDLEALHNLVEYAFDLDPDARLVLLGDLVDRGPYSFEAVLYFLSLVFERPNRMLLVAGDHDLGIAYDAERDRFFGSVDPSEFPDALNAGLDGETGVFPDDDVAWATVGRWFAELADAAPVAVYLPDGTLLSHGGFPHRDRWDALQTVGDLAGSACLQDYVWLRAHPNLPLKRPNRSTLGCQFGHRDFREFSELAAEKLSVPVRRLIRGHDHHADGYCLYQAYADPCMIGVNSMALEPAQIGLSLDGRGTPCVVRLAQDSEPEVHRLKPPVPAAVAATPTTNDNQGIGEEP